jgi:hypothetical protein
MLPCPALASGTDGVGPHHQASGLIRLGVILVAQVAEDRVADINDKTVPHGARQMMLVGRRWLPGVEITVIGDQAYSVHELGGACARRGVRLVAPLRMDAALYGPAPPREPGTKGRPRVKGERWQRLD